MTLVGASESSKVLPHMTVHLQRIYITWTSGNTELTVPNYPKISILWCILERNKRSNQSNSGVYEFDLKAGTPYFGPDSKAGKRSSFCCFSEPATDSQLATVVYRTASVEDQVLCLTLLPRANAWYGREHIYFYGDTMSPGTTRMNCWACSQWTRNAVHNTCVQEGELSSTTCWQRLV